MKALGPLDMDWITANVATFYRIAVGDLRGPRRFQSYAVPRQVAMYLIRKHTGASLMEIGEYFDRDHSTVIHACRLMAGHFDRMDRVGRDVVYLDLEMRDLQTKEATCA